MRREWIRRRQLTLEADPAAASLAATRCADGRSYGGESRDGSGDFHVQGIRCQVRRRRLPRAVVGGSPTRKTSGGGSSVTRRSGGGMAMRRRGGSSTKMRSGVLATFCDKSISMITTPERLAVI